MAVVTLHSGRVVNLTPANVDDAIREDLAAYQRDGIQVDGAALMEAMYGAAGKAYDTAARAAAEKYAQAVLSNPLVQVSDAVTAAAAAAEKAGDNPHGWLATIIGGIIGLNSTVRILAICGAVVVVGGATAYVVYKVRR